MILGFVGDVEELGEFGGGDAVDDSEDERTVDRVEPLAGFVQDKKWRLFDESASDEKEALLAETQRTERSVGKLSHAYDFEPLFSDLQLGGIGFLIKADTVEESGDNDGEGIGADAVLLMKSGRDDAEMIFDIPDCFTLTAAHSHDGNVVGVALGVISADEIDQSGFAAAIGATDFPMLAAFDKPVESGDDFPSSVNDGDLVHRDERAFPRRRRGRRIAGRKGVQFRIQLHELSEGGVAFDFVAGPGKDALTLIDTGKMRCEVLQFVEAIDHNDEGDRF